MSLFRGLIAYPVTPADTSGRVDEGALRSLVEILAGRGVDGIGLLGSTGGAVFLSRAERRRAVRIAVRAAAGRVPVTVGVGALRTDRVVALALDAAEEGADGLLLAPVSYTPLLPDEVFVLFETVASATRLPVCLYDNPATTGFSFPDALLRALGTLPGMVAVKRPAPDAGFADWVGAQRALLPEACALGCSVDWNAAGALLAGADAWHSVLAGILPEPCLRLHRAARAGDAAEAGRLRASLEPILALFRARSSFRVVHAMAAHAGFGNGLPPAPVQPLDPATRALVTRAMDAWGG